LFDYHPTGCWARAVLKISRGTRNTKHLKIRRGCTLPTGLWKLFHIAAQGHPQAGTRYQHAHLKSTFRSSKVHSCSKIRASVRLQEHDMYSAFVTLVRSWLLSLPTACVEYLSQDHGVNFFLLWWCGRAKKVSTGAPRSPQRHQQLLKVTPWGTQNAFKKSAWCCTGCRGPARGLRGTPQRKISSNKT
jgi:hypothetical protein